MARPKPAEDGEKFCQSCRSGDRPPGEFCLLFIGHKEARKATKIFVPSRAFLWLNTIGPGPLTLLRSQLVNSFLFLCQPQANPRRKIFGNMPCNFRRVERQAICMRGWGSCGIWWASNSGSRIEVPLRLRSVFVARGLCRFGDSERGSA